MAGPPKLVSLYGFELTRKVLIVASNRLLGLSAGTVALQLAVQRLATVASNCCDGVTVVLDVAVELLPPPQEARRTVKKAKENIRIHDFINLDLLPY
jgi:hypothetical protein